MTRQSLDIYFKNIHAGILTQDASGTLSFVYNESYTLNSEAIPFSVSLPFSQKPFIGPEVKAYFSGLLPDETIKERLADYLGLSQQNSFALLKAIGGECAGALSFYPAGESPLASREDHNVILDQKKLQEIMSLLQKRPLLAGDDGYRLSLAGAQNKLAVGYKNNQIILIKNGLPTTHILKPLIGHVPESVHNEFFCMKLAKKVGIDAPETFIHLNGTDAYYLVQRYDRHITAEGETSRIHQEDFCQALSIPPEMKYEREGGPSLYTCQKLITNYSKTPALDLQKFLNIVLFNFFIGNSDAHGKNFSLLYYDKKPVLAPAYDLLSTAIYPNLSNKMAMKIGNKYNPNHVFLRHWYDIIADTNRARQSFEKHIKKFFNNILEQALSLINELETQGFSSKIYNDIIQIIKRRSEIL